MNDRKAKVLATLKSHPGGTVREIAKMMDLYGPSPLKTVRAILEQLQTEGAVVRSGDRVSGVRWQPMRPSVRVDVTESGDDQHDAWMRYWHPRRRTERRAERLEDSIRSG